MIARGAPSARCIGAALLVAAAVVSGCNPSLTETGSISGTTNAGSDKKGPTPFTAATTRCEIGEADRIPGTSVPADLGVYLGCVGSYGNGEQRQAAGWLRDWVQASACMPSCAVDQFDGLANKRLRDSLHFILAATLPADGASEPCVAARRNLRTHVDETSNLILGWRPHAAQTCTVDKRRRAAEAARTEFFRAFDATRGKIEAFQKSL